MGKIIRFSGAGKKENKGKKEGNVRSIYSEISFKDKVRKGVEEYILSQFAVKTVLGMDVVFKQNDKNEIGVIGAIAYEHKRRAGNFVAEFIGKGYVDKNGQVVIDNLAFKLGEPELYSSIEKIMKAKKILPEIKELE